MKPCPNCAQLIETTDFKCPYCQKTLTRDDENFLKFRLFITLIFGCMGILVGGDPMWLFSGSYIYLCWQTSLIGGLSGLAVGYLYGIMTFSIKSQNFFERIMAGTLYGVLAGMLSGACTAALASWIAMLIGAIFGAIPGFILGIVFSFQIANIRTKSELTGYKILFSRQELTLKYLVFYILLTWLVIASTFYFISNRPGIIPEATKYFGPPFPNGVRSESDEIKTQNTIISITSEIPEQHFDKPFGEEISPEQKNPEQAMDYKSYIQNGEYEKAINSIRRFLNLRSNSPYLRKSLLTQRGDLFMVTDKYQDALNDYTEALQIIRTLQNGTVPENQSYISEGSSLNLLRRGTAYRKLGLFDQALVDLTTAIAEKPTERLLTESYLQRGLTYKAINDNERFQNDFKEVSKHWKNIAEGFYALDGSHWFQYGTFIWYNEDGTTKAECTYQNDEVVGACKYFNPDGSVK